MPRFQPRGGRLGEVRRWVAAGERIAKAAARVNRRDTLQEPLRASYAFEIQSGGSGVGERFRPTLISQWCSQEMP